MKISVRNIPSTRLLLCGSILIASAACGGSPGSVREAQGPAADSPSNRESYRVTAAEGPSWIHHLGVDLAETRMGQMGGDRPPSPPPESEPDLAHTGLPSVMHRFLGLFQNQADEAAEVLDETFTVSGADLYRMSCQSCHGPDGTGAPPEIHDLTGPVRGTSADAIQRRMEERGASIDRPMAEQLAFQAEQALRQRLAEGGEKMPPFAHLRGDEIEALLGYLRRLTGVPDSGDLRRVPESAARVGEHVVKGTCHICHDATGPGGHRAMMAGIIPSLASFPRDYGLSSVLLQVAHGSSSMMRRMRGGGGMGMMGRGHGGMGMMGRMRGGDAVIMPALPFLTDDEVAAAYFYLAEYPPHS